MKFWRFRGRYNIRLQIFLTFHWTVVSIFRRTYIERDYDHAQVLHDFNVGLAVRPRVEVAPTLWHVVGVRSAGLGDLREIQQQKRQKNAQNTLIGKDRRKISIVYRKNKIRPLDSTPATHVISPMTLCGLLH